MMSDSLQSHTRLDKLSVLLYVLLIIWGWMSIYAADYSSTNETNPAFYDLSTRAGRQLLWITACGLLGMSFVFMNYRLFSLFSYFLYGGVLVLLIGLLFFGKEVAGSRSWFSLGPLNFQPSELGKYATILALARFLSISQLQPNSLRHLFWMCLIIGLPMVLIVAQGDTGTALIYASLLLVMYRGGMNPTPMFIGAYLVLLFVLVLFVREIFIVTGVVVIGLLLIAFIHKRARYIGLIGLGALLSIAYVVGLDLALDQLLKPHQHKRIQVLIRPEADPFGYGWNVTQSKIAIGAGGLTGKGYLAGTQTKLDFVPEKTTDFIFCTLAEEFGWMGSILLIALFVGLIIRIIQIAERQNSRFALLFGHGVAAIFMLHFSLNLAMSIGLFPVIGIPLPFISYGGSSLLVFSCMLFTLLKLDTARKQVLARF